MSRKKETPPSSLTSKIPTLLRFPLLVLSSLTLSSALYTSVSGFTAGDLSSVSRSIDDWWQVAGLIGWKIAELAVGWWGEYDSEHSKDNWNLFLQKLIGWYRGGSSIFDTVVTRAPSVSSYDLLWNPADDDDQLSDNRRSDYLYSFQSTS